MKPSGLLQRQKKLTEAYAEIVAHVYQQYDMDILSILLHQNYGFGKGRILKFAEEFQKTKKQFLDALAPDCATEADYCQEKIDRMLREIFEDDTVPFEKRYPDLKKVRYDGKK